ncbi:TonB-dependent receptor [Undibacterium sp. CY18W]|uniref:TonB-dependent receptor n=1 Tax=Undibacterium hunanense TaxID=2762292 RepID=A0ABR6ZTW5_9BURK|nr:TonB-dependent receptor [Undibacterium hunanense]MBC3919297.1 TonB-dependent receptor [Undibacterium hunanense]
MFAAGTVVAFQWGGAASAQEAATAAAAVSAENPVTVVEVTGKVLGKGEARANSVIDKETIQQQPAGLDPLKLLTRVPGLQVGSSDALTGSFSMRLSMRGLNKEQIGISIDGIPNGSTLSNGGTMPNRLMDTANISRVDVSQTAGDLGTPSNQALGGYIDFRTRDPSKERGGDAEISIGDYGYQRAFVRYDTGRFDNGISAYGDFSHEYVRTWPGDQSGRSKRDHADIRVLKDLGNGSSVRATVSYNKMADNDYDAVALRAVSAPFYKSNFETNSGTDGLTDYWTGNPAIDQNYRGTRGIASTEVFSHIDWIQKLGDASKLTIKPYFHHQEGDGWFYVPYKQRPTNGSVYSAVAPGGSPVSTVQECYANQYQTSASGGLIPTASVVLTADASARLLAGACPAAAKYAMNPVSQWGAREATTRRGGYEMDRKGTLAELATNLDSGHSLRVGGWYEHISRAKTRNWYQTTDPTVSSAYSDSNLYSITQDRHYNSNAGMMYAQDKMNLLDDRFELDVGATYQRFSETYSSPVEFNGERQLSVSSGILPKIAALYRINDDWEFFVSGSKNFSAIPDSVFEGTAAVDAKNGIKPETSINKDAGIRWLKGPYGLGMTVYAIDYRDRISIQNGNPNGDIFSRDAKTTFQNLGGISSRGVELTARASFEHLELYANYAFNDAHYVEDTVAEGIKAGDPVLGAARHNAFAEVTWKSSAGWRLTANAKYVGKAAGTYNVVANTVVKGGPDFYPREYMPNYTLIGLSGSYRLNGSFLGAFTKTELAFNIDNLFNKQYLAGVGSELTTSNPLTSGRYFLGSPRTLFVTMRTHF